MGRPLVDNAADPSQVKKAGAKERYEQRVYSEDLKHILTLPAGRNVLWEIIARTGYFGVSFTGNSATFHNEGCRSIGKGLFEDIMQSYPEIASDLLKEIKNRGGFDG